MSASTPTRLLFRQSRPATRRITRSYASTAEVASNAAGSSKEAASNVTSKASEGLSRVTSSAGPAASGTAQGLSNAVGKIGGRTGRLINYAQSMIPPTVYYSKVGFELSKLVARGQKMNPPDMATFQQHFGPFIHAFRNPTTLSKSISSTVGSISPEGILNRIRNASTQQMVSAGVIGAEILGFFTVGEMIGKFKVVGYRGDVHPHATSATPH